MSIFAAIAERKIREAIERGELADLALKGQPIVHEDLTFVPEELRMGYKILKNAGVLPEELELKREIVTLEGLLAACRDDEERQAVKKRLTAQRLRFDLLMEKIRRNGAFQQYAAAAEQKLCG